jgi:Mg-chelatase subunit ChlD
MPGLTFIYPGALWLLLLLIPLWWFALALPRRLASWRFYTSLALRSTLILALILALAGAQIIWPVNALTTVFVIDSSDSISPSMRGQAEAYVQEALATMQQGQQAAVVVFGENALVERAPSEVAFLGRISSVPVANRTNIGEALQLGLALFPADAQKRLVLLSDGGENSGDAQETARLAAARGVPVDIVDLSDSTTDAEVLVAELDAPDRVRDTQELTLVATVESNRAQAATLRLLSDQDVLAEQQVQLAVGVNRYSFTVPAEGQGFQRYRVQVDPAEDGRVQNNEATALVQVQGPPRVLLVEGQPQDAVAFANALSAANITVETVSPDRVPTDLSGLSAYEAVVLINVPARNVPVQTTAALPIYVRDLGRGLVMVGGEESYGVGGYGRTPIEEALPVYMDVRDREERPDLALVFVIDKSGSMDACHCAGPNRSSAQFQSGERKIDIAKEAVAQAATLLGPSDTLAIVAFDDGAQWVLPATAGPTGDQVISAVSNIEPRGSTNVRAGMRMAEEVLAQTDARIKHAILLTDGWGSGSDNVDLARRMRDQGMTLTVVAAGSGSADYLDRLAQAGGGRYYPAEDMSEVPQIFLQETITAVGNYIIEEPTLPAQAADSPLLTGLASGLPTLYGYNGTTAKETARQVLVAPDETPILATWQYGLGRSIAWTSDVKAKWARDWVNWSEFPRFASQMIDWVLPAQTDQGVSTNIQVQGASTEIVVNLADDAGMPRENVDLTATLLGSDGSRQEVPLEQVAPGEYRGSVSNPLPGTYLVQLAGKTDGRAVVQEVAGMVVPYSAEYRQNQPDPALLAALRAETGGNDISSEPAAAFAPTGERVVSAREIGLPLLWLALILLPLDIGLRRLFLQRRDFVAIGRSFAREKPVPPTTPDNFERLNQARQRAHRPVPPLSAPPLDTLPPDTPPARGPVPPAPPSANPPAANSPTDERDPLERLREAKERARRRARGDE